MKYYRLIRCIPKSISISLGHVRFNRNLFYYNKKIGVASLYTYQVALIKAICLYWGYYPGSSAPAVAGAVDQRNKAPDSKFE